MKFVVPSTDHRPWPATVTLQSCDPATGEIVETTNRFVVFFGDWTAEQFDPQLDWDKIARIRDLWGGKLILKGIMDVEDARLAADSGADGASDSSPPRSSPRSSRCPSLRSAAAASDPTAGSPRPSVTPSDLPTFTSVRRYEGVALPVRLRIPEAGVDTSLIRLGLTAEGWIAAPKAWSPRFTMLCTSSL